MTAASPAFAQFGYTLALAERRLRKILRDQLAERDIEPETWYAMQLISLRGPALDRTELSDELANSGNLDGDSTQALLRRLETDGLIRGNSEIELTMDGQALHRSLREYLAVPRDRFLSQFDPDDIETTVRTLRAIAERATSV